MTHSQNLPSLRRRGMAIPEWFCILAVLAVGSLVLWSTFGESVGGYTDTTADAVADPSLLLSHPAFQSGGGSENPSAHGGSHPRGDQGQDQTASHGGHGQDQQPTDHGQGQSGPRGNNGVGNGTDPQPPGNPPVNDGPGTGPGNPGNRGGANR